MVKIERTPRIGSIDCAVLDQPNGWVTVYIDEELITEQGAAALADTLGAWLAARRGQKLWQATG